MPLPLVVWRWTTLPRPEVLYYYAFVRHFDQIAEQPYLYAAVDYIKAGYRRRVCGADSIHYHIVDETVEIMRILGQQDAGEELD